ncbi:MAG: PAS domain-containing protein, partial [Candidatus Aminicenantales bacterium]
MNSRNKPDEKLREELFECRRRIAELEKSESRYRDLVEKAGIAILIEDEEGNFKYFNNRFLELFGYSKEDVRNLSISSLVHPYDVAGVLAFRRRQTQKKTPSRHEFRGIRKDGSTDHFEMDVMALKKKGKILGFHSFIWDVTHRKKMEEALRESERKHRYIVENVHEGILIVQGRRRIYFNDKLLEILDCTREEYSSMPLFSYVHPDDRKRVEKRFEQQMRGKKVSRICETRFLDKNGSTKWIRINAVPITWEGSPALL